MCTHVSVQHTGVSYPIVLSYPFPHRAVLDQKPSSLCHKKALRLAQTLLNITHQLTYAALT